MTLAILVIAGITYPFLLYAGSGHVPSLVFAAFACALLALRAWLGPAWTAPLQRPLFIAIPLIAVIALLDGNLAAKAYPVAISWGFALLFAQSLWSPVTLVAHFATLQGNILTPSAQHYCRRVTFIWAIWLSLNGGIAALLALFGQLEAWTLWTGLASYLVTGGLFAGEFTLRRLLRRRHAQG